MAIWVVWLLMTHKSAMASTHSMRTAAEIRAWQKANPGQRVDLSNLDLRGADLYGADLPGANLSGADLRGVDRRRA